MPSARALDNHLSNSNMILPTDPIAAVTHPDPYPYYDTLVAERPLYHDESLGMWVASGAEEVNAILTNENCSVRPLNEPVPSTLLDSPAGEVFRRLVRMNDGTRHHDLKSALTPALDAAGPAFRTGASAELASEIAAELARDFESLGPTRYAFRLPVYVVARLLGVPSPRLPEVTRWTAALVRRLAPTHSAAEAADGNRAAVDLCELFLNLGHTSGATPTHDLRSVFAEAYRTGGDGAENTIAANCVGLLLQSYEATAGLLGNSLVALARKPGVAQLLADAETNLTSVVSAVALDDPPIQNTRRYLTRGTRVAGQEMHANATVLVVLAAATRYRPTGARPGCSAPRPPGSPQFTFGAGSHQCPGERLAVTIAEAGVRQLIAVAGWPILTQTSIRYQASVNARVPLLDACIAFEHGSAALALSTDRPQHELNRVQP